jgi:hypothetical protein
VKQNSDTRARWQHSTVPVDKRALRAQANLRAHQQHSATEVNRNTLQTEPPTTLVLTSEHTTLERIHPHEFSITTVASEARRNS